MLLDATYDRRHAFTLIELVVVITIIAVLIGLMIPSLSRAHEQAKAIKCVSNLSAISKGMFYYSEDTGNGNGYLPQLAWLIESDGGFGYWTEQVGKYVKFKRTRAGSRNGLTVCPAHEEPQIRHISGPLAGAESTLAEKIRCDSGQGGGTRRRGGNSGGGASSRDCQIEPVSYTGSCDTLETTAQYNYFPMKWSQIERPYCFILLTEVSQRDGREARCFRMTDLLAEARNDPDYKRHYGGQSAFSNGSNYMFADGHTAWHSAEFSATKLICCLDIGKQEGNSFSAGAEAAKIANCGGPGADGGSVRRR